MLCDVTSHIGLIFVKKKQEKSIEKRMKEQNLKKKEKKIKRKKKKER